MGLREALREAILAADDMKIVPVDVPEWPGVDRVYVRTVSAQERLELAAANEKALKAGESETLAHGRLAAAAICDEFGNPVFTEADGPLLARKCGAAIGKIVLAWLKLNGMSSAVTEEKEKNS